MKRYIYPALLLILMGLILAPLLLSPGEFVYPRGGKATDLTITHWPAMTYNQRSIRQHGQVPLWRTTIASGGPWVANPQSWLLYPPAWLYLILPIPWTMNLLLLGHLLLAALATYAFARKAMGLKPAGAALAGLAFALAPWISGRLAAGHLNVILALAWLPVALIGSHLAATTGKAGGALLAGFAWAAAMLNHLQMAVYVAALTGAWFLFVMFASRDRTSRGRQMLLLSLIPVTALLLAAVLLIPLAEALPYLNRTTLTVEEAGIFSLSWPQLVTLVIPGYGGEPEQAVYLGLPIAVLVAAGLVLKRDRVAWFFVISAAVGMVFALGPNGPLFPFLFRLVPGLDWLRVPVRIWGLVAFCLAVLAGRGLDALSGQELAPAARRRVIMVSLIFLVTGLILAVGLALIYQPPPPAVWVLGTLATLTAASLVLRAQNIIKPGPFVLLVLLLVSVDLGLVRAAWVEMRAPADAFAWGADAARFLAKQPGQFRTYSPSYSLPQHTALQHDLSLADGVDPIQLAHYAKFLSVAGGFQVTGYSPTLPPVLNDASAQLDSTRLGMLNVGYVLAEYPIQAKGFEIETQIGETYVYANQEALPRAFVLPSAQPSSEQVSLPDEIANVQPGQISSYSPNHIFIEVDLEEPSLLVLGEVWYPGWHALDNGNQVPIYRVENTLRGVYLDRGVHAIQVEYTPWTVLAGLAMSGGTLIALLAFAAYRARKQP